MLTGISGSYTFLKAARIWSFKVNCISPSRRAGSGKRRPLPHGRGSDGSRGSDGNCDSDGSWSSDWRRTSFRAYRLCDLGAESGFQGMPRQRGALDARRVIAHAAEDDQFAEVLADGGIGGQQFVKLLQELECFLAGLAFETFGHQGRGSGGDG